MRVIQRLLRSLLLFLFNLLYHQFAFLYDWVAAAVSLGRWQSWVLATVDYLPGPQVLELGHGPGHLQIALLDRGVNTFGIDESSQMSRLANKRLRRSGIQPRLVNGYAQYSPFAENTFDQIVATFPSTFITQLNTAQEIKRLLKPDGKLIILPSARIDGGSFLDRLATSLFRLTGSYHEPSNVVTDILHQIGFKSKIIQQSCRDSTVIILIADLSI